jgi:hypothetical protein
VEPSKPPSKPSFRSGIRAYAEAERRNLGPHLDAEDLVAYHERRLAGDAAERVRDHLVLCPECSDLLLDLDELAAPSQSAGAPDLTTAEIESSWRDLSSRLQAEEAPVVHFPRRTGSPVLPWAVAAALLLAVVGLSIRDVTLSHRVYELSQPEVGDIAEYSLKPAGDHVRSAEVPLSPLPSKHTSRLALAPPPEGWPAGAVELELRTAEAGGQPLWKVWLRPDEKRDLRVTLKAGSISPGSYRLLAYRGPQLAPVEYELPIGS